MKKKIIIILILILIGLLIAFLSNTQNIENIKETYLAKIYGVPIDSNTGVINNDYFFINNEGKASFNTTNGINNALEYANKHNIEYIKLEKGTYLINGTKNNGYESSGIIIPSENITLDLNGSTIKEQKNNKEHYSVISIHNCDNVKITNGTIEGDKNEHNFTGNGTHEWGYGVSVYASKNINIDSLKIINMTGDGIFVSDIFDGKNKIISENINITNNDISECRRQGISIISAKNVEIAYNEIYEIKGTLPSSLIDLENNNDGSQKVDQINIHDNKLYNQNRAAITTYNNWIFNVDIIANEIVGNLYLWAFNERVLLSDNYIKNSIIETYNQKEYTKNILLLNNNNLEDTNINIKNVNDFISIDNEFNNSKINVENANVCINKCYFKTQSTEQDYAYQISKTREDKEFKLFIGNNEFYGNYIKREIINNISDDKINRYSNNINAYINSFDIE